MCWLLNSLSFCISLDLVEFFICSEKFCHLYPKWYYNGTFNMKTNINKISRFQFYCPNINKYLQENFLSIIVPKVKLHVHSNYSIVSAQEPCAWQLIWVVNSFFTFKPFCCWKSSIVKLWSQHRCQIWFVH